MGELGHWLHSTDALITKRADHRYLFQKEESKRRVTTSIFEKGIRRLYSRQGLHLQLNGVPQKKNYLLPVEMCVVE